MFGNLDRWLRSGRKLPVLPAGQRVYAVGDVHGCKEQMLRLLAAIDRHRQGFHGLTHLIFLGDLIDRGPDSAGVLDHLLTEILPADQVTFLMGNHEEIMLDCYNGRTDRYAPWLRFGGLETLESYGLSRERVFMAPSRLRSLLAEAVPPEHIAFLETFQNQMKLGDYIFVHAGIRPGKSLEEQVPSDLRWITTEFLGDQRDHGFTVVHGHTIVPEVLKLRNRIGVDTGCYKSGVLSALILEGGEVSVIDTLSPPMSDDRVRTL